MYRMEKTVYKREIDHNPSFSSTLLDKIYRSIGDGDNTRNGDFKFYRETMQKQSKVTTKCNKSGRGQEEDYDAEVSSLQGACLIDKWMQKKVNEKENAGRKLRHEYDHDVHFFSSTSTSSDCSSGGSSSSDTESMHVTKSKSSSFVTSRPKPVRTRVSARSDKPLKTEKAESLERTQRTLFDDYHYSSASDYTPKLNKTLFQSKSRATKTYGNLKKVKQPISPGGRLANFINSLFTSSNTKKARGPSSIVSCDDEKKLKSGQVSTCSSASSFSRSCLSKNSPSTRERLRNGVKRSVRFCPVSVIVNEDSRPYGQKCIYKEQDSSSASVTVPAVRRIVKSPARKLESRRVEEMATKFLKEYRLNQTKNNDYIRSNYIMEEMDEDDDDAASYSSSDLFELDHHVLIGNNRYREELPVYETTHVETNRAIANGLKS